MRARNFARSRQVRMCWVRRFHESQRRPRRKVIKHDPVGVLVDFQPVCILVDPVCILDQYVYWCLHIYIKDPFGQNEVRRMNVV